MKPTISVIVPVYNAEKFVGKCIESVQAQSYIDWQMILVDDGSKDKSLEVCQRYADTDNRIRVIHQENAGAGAARNTALEKAVGEYVVFVDSDDTISETYFAELVKHNEDVVFIDVQDVDENGTVLKREYMSPFKDYPLDDITRAQMTGKLPWGGVRKAAKLKLLNENKIRYTHHKIGEEALYSFRVLDKAKNVSFIPEAMYNYVQRAGSLSRSVDEDPWGNVALSLRDFIKSEGEEQYKKYANTLNAFLLASCAASFQRLAKMYSCKEYMQKASARRKLFLSLVDNNYPIDWKHLNMKAKVVGWLILHNCKLSVRLLAKVRG